MVIIKDPKGRGCYFQKFIITDEAYKVKRFYVKSIIVISFFVPAVIKLYVYFFLDPVLRFNILLFLF